MNEIKCERVENISNARLRRADAPTGLFAWSWERRKGARVRLLTIVLPVANKIFGGRIHNVPVYECGKETPPYLNAAAWNGDEDNPTLARPLHCNPDGAGNYEWYGYLRQGYLVSATPMNLSEEPQHDCIIGR